MRGKRLSIGLRTTLLAILTLTLFVASTTAQTFTVLHIFEGSPADGSYPEAPLIQATDGNLYGTTYTGGASAGGTVFKITPDGTLTTLYSFCSQSDCVDGSGPYAPLVQGTNGNLYGTTGNGGSNGDGTVFKITLSGKLTTLYSFCSQSSCTDGEFPNWLVQATDGDFYGTTGGGGSNGDGTVFKINASGALTTLHSFDGSDGDSPNGLIQATDGNFYGTTFEGGVKDSKCLAGGCGTVFKITPDGTLTTLYRFCRQSGCTDGAEPFAPPVQATNGDFYGTTTIGGFISAACAAKVAGDYGCGTVFKTTPRGTLATLHSFCSQSGCTDGLSSYAGLVQATDWNFYGTTEFGGANSDGTVFKITPRGKLITLYTFCSQSGCADGDAPNGLVQDTNGRFYGTTSNGGSLSCTFQGPGCGIVFSLSKGLGRFVETLPTSAKVGSGVKILGTDLTSTTKVTFNGTPAIFKVVSSSLIKTTVPTGATTGEVEVTTPHGTLKSNVAFRVVDLR